jgi:hypothetical protein
MAPPIKDAKRPLITKTDEHAAQRHLAIVPIEKLRDYSLNPNSDEGKSKARVFAAALGIRRDDAIRLQAAVLETVRCTPCRRGPSSRYGAKYVVDMMLSLGEKRAWVRTAWLVPMGKDTPRLVSIYVLPSKAWEPRE